jgi:general secretion pathway protein G
MIKANKKSGFTLLELLVVISIIGILIALGVAAFSTAQRKTRDARRRGDMQAAQDALEQYYAANGASYPDADDCAGIETTLGQDFLPGGMPSDPKPNHTAYVCTSSGGTNEYCLCAYLETGGGNSTSSDCTSWSQGGDWFCVSNLQ